MADETLLLPLIPRPQLATKRCKRCCKTKPLSEFHLRPEQGRRRAECKECYRTAMTARRDPEENRRRVREWQKKNPEKHAEHSRLSYERSRENLGSWVGKALATTRVNCKRRGLECSITASDVVAMYATQNGLCALTGRPLVFGSKGQQRDSLSIDRIEAGGAYSLGNVRLVTHQANMARSCWSDEELFSFCEAVLATRAASC